MYKVHIAHLIIFYSLLFSLSIRQAQAIFVKVSNDPVISTTIDSWDSEMTSNPSAILDNGTIKVYYTGANSQHIPINFGIGFTTSNDGVSYTKNTTNPVMPHTFVNSSDSGVQHPNLIVKNPNEVLKYKIWFNNIDTNINFFELYYSDSADGISWNLPIKLIFSNLPFQWEIAGRTNPKVYFNPNIDLYEMWYSARSPSSSWTVGYARSSDGINWTQNSNPVLSPSLPWEGSNVANVDVFVESNIYHMFYHADESIGYSESIDGINWEKYTSPLLSPDKSNSSNFDYFRVSSPSVIKYNNNYLLFYDALGNTGKWQVGLAKSEELPNLGLVAPSPTPTSTPSPTPTPTSIPTPTPTPVVPISSFPVIIVPGLGASWNPADLFSCNPSTGSSWSPLPFINVYDNLINTLTQKAKMKIGRDVYLYSYDWRQPLPIQSQRLKNFIDTVVAGRPGVKVRLIGHSFGGLVIRSYLTDYWTDDKTSMVMTVGSPHQGTVYVYPLWEKGKIPHENSVFNIAINHMVQYCQMDPITLKKRSAREVVQTLSPSIENLLPVFNYLYKDRQVIDIASMYYKNTWLLSHPFPDSHFFIPFETLSGVDMKTLLSYSVTNPTLKDTQNGDWKDGKPDEKNQTKSGDGTILLKSSSIPNIPNSSLSKNHIQIIASKEGVRKILSFFQISVDPTDTYIPAAGSTQVLSIAIDKPVEFTVNTSDSQQSADKQISSFVSPKNGNYKIKIKGNKAEIAKLLVTYLDENKDEENSIIPIKLNKDKTTELNFVFDSKAPLPSSINSVQY